MSPTLSVCIKYSVLNSHVRNHINRIRYTRRKVAKLTKPERNWVYWDRLAYLGLYSLHRRSDLIQVCKLYVVGKLALFEI